ncbi:MAG: SMP-30/gluconolactonase/LRE family protein [Pseudomonadota bacterium]
MRLIAILLILIGAIAAAIFGVLRSFGHFSDISREFSGLCTPVTGVVGPEDISIDAAGARAFISSLDRRDPNARGAIHMVDPQDPLADGGWRDLTGGVPEAFRPLGLDYYEDEEAKRLFVVNEANSGVELFDVGEDGSLTHMATFRERRLTSPNNIAAVGRRAFYVTNDLKPGRNSLMGDVHFLTRAASGYALYSDGAIWRLAADKLRFANGIDISPDGRTVYVAESAGMSLRIYKRNPDTGALRETEKITLNATPANLSVDEDGVLWIGALPKPLSVPLHEADPRHLSPSQAFRLSPGGDLESVYLDDGSEISASTVAAHLNGTLMIGALFENKFLLCDLPDGAE